MAYQKELTDWVLRNIKPLSIKVREFTWARERLSGRFHFEVEMNLRGKVLVGSGVDLSQEIAFAKACSEVIERAVCLDSQIHSTGVACHPILKNAQQNAMLELFERDAIFCHFLSKTPLYRPPSQVLDNCRLKFENVFRLAEDLKIKLSLLQLKSAGDSFCFVCLGSGEQHQPQFGGMLGLGCSLNENEGAEKAVIELAKRLASLKFETSESISESEFREIVSPTGLDRQRLFKNLSFWNELGSLFSPSEKLSAGSSIGPEVSFKTLSLPQELIDAPVFAVKAFADELQTPSDISGNLGAINFNRISNFVGRSVHIEELETRQHFVG